MMQNYEENSPLIILNRFDDSKRVKIVFKVKKTLKRVLRSFPVYK